MSLEITASVLKAVFCAFKTLDFLLVLYLDAGFCQPLPIKLAHLIRAGCLLSVLVVMNPLLSLILMKPWDFSKSDLECNGLWASKITVKTTQQDNGKLGLGFC